MSLDEAALRRAFADLRSRVAYIERALGLFVDDAELDRPRGNIKIVFDPRSWRGPSHKGKRASDCSPEFLEAYAEALTFMAEHPKPDADPKRAGYNRLDSARARSWARRLRQAKAAPAPIAEHLLAAAADLERTASAATPAGLFDDEDDFSSEDSKPDAALEDEAGDWFDQAEERDPW
jgi:hypothetical protein